MGMCGKAATAWGCLGQEQSLWGYIARAVSWVKYTNVGGVGAQIRGGVNGHGHIARLLSSTCNFVFYTPTHSLFRAAFTVRYLSYFEELDVVIRACPVHLPLSPFAYLTTYTWQQVDVYETAPRYLQRKPATSLQARHEPKNTATVTVNTPSNEFQVTTGRLGPVSIAALAGTSQDKLRGLAVSQE
jgi:hypothetical protein